MPPISPTLLPVLMLFASNVFMTFAWYGHLKFRDHALVTVVLASWGIAFFEYWLAVPANRWGRAVYTAARVRRAIERSSRPRRAMQRRLSSELHRLRGKPKEPRFRW